MAVVINNNQDPQNQNQQAPGSLGGPVTLSQNAGGGTGAGAAQVQQKGSGRFTNLKRLIDANQGAGQRMASRIESTAEKQTRGQQNEANQQLSGIRDAIGQEKNRLNQATNIADTIRSGSTQDIQNLAQNQLNDVTALRQGQSNVNQLQQQQQQVAGSLENVAQRFANTADAARTEQGRFGLLREAMGGPSYTSGQRRLDQLLLQGTGAGALGQLQQNLQTKAQQQQQQLGQIQAELNPELSGIQSLTQQRQQEVLGALGSFGDKTGALGGLNEQLEMARSAAEQKQAEDLAGIQARMQSGNLTEADAQLLGLRPDQRIFDVNLGEYSNLLKTGDTNITQADVASEDQMNRLAALQQLAGIDPTSINLGVKEGALGPQFDRQQDLASAIGARQEQYDKMITDFNKHLPFIQSYVDRQRTTARGVGDMGGGMGYSYNPGTPDTQLTAALRNISDQGYTDQNFKSILDAIANDPTSAKQAKSKTVQSYLDYFNTRNLFNTLNPTRYAVDPSLITPTQMGQVE